MNREERLKAAVLAADREQLVFNTSERGAFMHGFEAGAEAEAESKWVEVKSKYDLPNDNKDYWAVDKDGEVIVRHGFSILMHNTTHYQPIIKPQPPLNQQ